MKQRGLGLGRWLILLFALYVVFLGTNKLHQFGQAVNRPAPPAKVLAASDSDDKQFILKVHKK